MRLQNIFLTTGISLILLLSWKAQAQSSAYKRKKPAAAKTDATDTAKSGGQAASKTGGKAEGKKGEASTAAAAKPESEKLDITELEQKYWAPKDTDFSVVQNRTYTKAKRVAVSYLLGPIVNDPFNSGVNHSLNVNYYLDERMGFEFMYQSSDLKDSDATDKFREFAGGQTRPDFNRDVSFYGVGFNFVPFYAKMSFMAKKIIYFDMQITPLIGMATYEQQSKTGSPEKEAFAYGLDVTQFFFFSKNFAVRANLHNRFYTSDVLGYTAGTVQRKNERTTTSMFLMGMTYFF